MIVDKVEYYYITKLILGKIEKVTFMYSGEFSLQHDVISPSAWHTTSPTNGSTDF